MLPTVAEILFKQYREWMIKMIGNAEHGAAAADDALRSARIATVETPFGLHERNDRVIVWDRGITVEGKKRLVAWAGPIDDWTLLHDVQDHVRVIWKPEHVAATRVFKTCEDTGTALVASYTEREHATNRDVRFFAATFTPNPMIADGYTSASGALRNLVSTLQDHATDLASIADRLEREGR